MRSPRFVNALTAGASAAAIVCSSFGPAWAQTPTQNVEAPFEPGNGRGAVTVSPLVSQQPWYVPPSGINGLGSAYGTGGCFSSVDVHSLNQHMTVDDNTGLLIRAEANYRLAWDHLQKASSEERKAAQTAFDEAERYLADVQQALSLPQGAPARAIVEAKRAERNADDGVDGIYVPNEYKDLRLQNIVAAQRTVKGQPVVHITGRILNTRKNAIGVPPLWFAGLNDKGDTVKTQQAVAQQSKRIAAGRSIPFAFDFPVSSEVQRTAVTFAPQNRAPRVGDTDILCNTLLPQSQDLHSSPYYGRWR